MALLVLDIQNQIYNQERRLRCVESVPKIVALIEKVRGAGNPVLYSLTNSAEVSDIREEVTLVPGEPIIKSGIDKFYGTELEENLGAKAWKRLFS